MPQLAGAEVTRPLVDIVNIEGFALNHQHGQDVPQVFVTAALQKVLEFVQDHVLGCVEGGEGAMIFIVQ